MQHPAAGVALPGIEIRSNQLVQLLPGARRGVIAQRRRNFLVGRPQPDEERAADLGRADVLESGFFGHGGFDQQLFFEFLLLRVRGRAAGLVVIKMQEAAVIHVDPVGAAGDGEIQIPEPRFPLGFEGMRAGNGLARFFSFYEITGNAADARQPEDTGHRPGNMLFQELT